MIDLFFSPYGAIKRSQFWMAILLQGVISFALIYASLGTVIAAIATGNSSAVGQMTTSFIVTVGILFLVTFWTSFCIVAKRLHDLDQSAWLYATIFIPYLGGLCALGLLIYCSFFPSADTTQYADRKVASGGRFIYEDEPDNSADIDAMIARAKAAQIAAAAPRPAAAMAGNGQMAMARPSGPPVFGKRR